MNAEINSTKVVWKIKSIDLISFNVEPNLKPSDEYDIENLNFHLGVDISVNPKEKNILISFQSKIFADKEQTELLGAIHTKGEFQILNFDEIFNEKSKNMSATILSTLIGVTLSSTRGMLVLLSKGTSFEKAIIPIIDPSVFLKPESRMVPH